MFHEFAAKLTCPNRFTFAKGSRLEEAAKNGEKVHPIVVDVVGVSVQLVPEKTDPKEA